MKPDARPSLLAIDTAREQQALTEDEVLAAIYRRGPKPRG
jgi:hypothetical protein